MRRTVLAIALFSAIACRRDARPSIETSSSSSVSSTVSSSASPSLSSSAVASSSASVRAVVVDTHADTPTEWLAEPFDLSLPSKHQVDFPKMRDGGLDAEFFVAYVPRSYAEHGAATFCTKLVEDIHRMVEAHPADASIAISTEEIRAIVASGRKAILIGIEGGHAIEDSIELLGAFHRLGARYLTLTHFNSNHWADSSGDVALHHGLTPFGESVVREMNRLGMMVDVSHASDETFYDVIVTTSAPIIASHSCARALCGKARNMDDDMLRAVAKNRGVVMINFLSMYLCDRSIVDHIEHVIDVAGVDSVGLGSDFDNRDPFPAGMEDASKVRSIADELRKRGHSQGDVDKIMGENFMRVFAEVERVARAAK